MNDPMGDAPTVERTKPGPKKGSKRRVTAKAQPRKQAQAAPVLQRGAPRPIPPRAEAARDPVRHTPRDGAVIAVGRDGQKLTRRRIQSGDPMDVPREEIPPGWDYQWNPVTILNKPIGEVVQGDLIMYQNGWRPVPASRHAGRWTPVGFEGDILMTGLRLEERPASLSEEARIEDQKIARAQVRDRTDALRLTQKGLPGANVASRRGNAGGLKIDFSDKGDDIPRPDYVAEGDAGFEE